MSDHSMGQAGIGLVVFAVLLLAVAYVATWIRLHRQSNQEPDRIDALVGWHTTRPFVEHDPCEGGCGNVVCSCAQGCQGTVEAACPHGRVICDECRTDCGDCVDDSRADDRWAGANWS